MQLAASPPLSPTSASLSRARGQESHAANELTGSMYRLAWCLLECPPCKGECSVLMTKPTASAARIRANLDDISLASFLSLQDLFFSLRRHGQYKSDKRRTSTKNARGDRKLQEKSVSTRIGHTQRFSVRSEVNCSVLVAIKSTATTTLDWSDWTCPLRSKGELEAGSRIGSLPHAAELLELGEANAL